jgi:hypothetical protein
MPPPVLGLPVQIAVTREHIAEGEPGECDSCPVAIALTEAIAALKIRNRADVSVYCEIATVAIGASVWSADLPSAAMDFIGRFDNAEPVWPLTFSLSWRKGGLL